MIPKLMGVFERFVHLVWPHQRKLHLSLPEVRWDVGPQQQRELFTSARGLQCGSPGGLPPSRAEPQREKVASGVAEIKKQRLCKAKAPYGYRGQLPHPTHRANRVCAISP